MKHSLPSFLKWSLCSINRCHSCASKSSSWHSIAAGIRSKQVPALLPLRLLPVVFPSFRSKLKYYLLEKPSLMTLFQGVFSVAFYHITLFSVNEITLVFVPMFMVCLLPLDDRAMSLLLYPQAATTVVGTQQSVNTCQHNLVK